MDCFWLEDHVDFGRKGIRSYFKKNFFDPGLFKRLSEDIRRISPDVIHIHNVEYSLNTVLLACGQKRIIKKIANFCITCPTCWGVKMKDLKLCNCKGSLKCSLQCLPLTSYILDHALPGFLTRFLLKRRVSAFVAPSKGLKDFLTECGFPNVIKIPNFKDESIWKKSGYTTERSVLFVGRLNRHKGAAYLIRAFADVAQKIPQARLSIVGNGPERQKLKDMTEEAGLGKRVEFAGEKDNAEVMEYMRRASVLAVPSIYREQFGIVIIEVMACGIPVVGFDIGGISELIEEGVNGYKVRRLDIKGLGNKIASLLEDREDAKIMGNKGYGIFLEKYSAKANLDKLIEVYKGN